MLLAGLYLTVVSSVALRRLGEGANAFVLTKRLVTVDAYDRMRNPMSLGFYLLIVGIGLVAGSTSISSATLLGVVPAHVFYLKYFEEYELELRLGEPYAAYKQRVPFLIPRLSLPQDAR
jgi:protein-S-isoprenylcysteine O-methyltransferase Ste14